MKWKKQLVKWTESRTYLSLQGGLTFSVPFTLFGAFILLLQNYTPDSLVELINNAWNIDLNQILSQVNYAVFSTISLWSSYGVSATYVAQETPADKSVAGLTGLIAYLILTVDFVSTENGFYLNMETVGAGGILLSLLSSLLVGICFSHISNHSKKKRNNKSTSAMLFGDTVSESNSKMMGIVRESFDPLIPVFACLGIALMGHLISTILFHEKLTFVFEEAIQAPFVYIADRLSVLLGFDFTISFLDWFGLHGIKITDNEAIRFGLPVVLNPRYFIPLIIAPMAGNIIVYLSLYSGYLPPFTMIKPPWTTPYILYGFLSSGYRGAIVECAILTTNIMIYTPFCIVC